MTSHTVLWVYIVFLLVGGLMGFLKAGSKVSLVTSAVAAAALSYGVAKLFVTPQYATHLAPVIGPDYLGLRWARSW